MRAHVTQVLPSIYKEAKIKKELIREVEMGPFKHQVDDGVDIRKAAYERFVLVILSLFVLVFIL